MYTGFYYCTFESLIRFSVPLVTWLQIFMTNMRKINIPPPKIETV